MVDALVVADFTTGPRGEDVEYYARIDGILDRYPPDNPVHRVGLALELSRRHLKAVRTLILVSAYAGWPDPFLTRSRRSGLS